jgi:hypothetical protein
LRVLGLAFLVFALVTACGLSLVAREVTSLTGSPAGALIAVEWVDRTVQFTFCGQTYELQPANWEKCTVFCKDWLTAHLSTGQSD